MMPMQFAPPPRHVPLSLRVANMFNGAAQLGWGVFGFGMIFFWVFTWNADFSFINFRGPFVQAIGRVTGVEATGASENRRQIHAQHYQYSVAGATLHGTSYTMDDVVPSGQPVMVEYKAADPARSRIVGMRRGMFGPFVLFVLIFPAIGLAILAGATAIGVRRTYLLRCGVFTTGVLKSKTPTNMEVNDRRVFALTFEFTGRNGRHHEVTAKSSQSAKLEDEAQEPLLYDPDDPSKACLLDDAPARPRMEMNGDLVGRPVAAMASLILPLIVTAANVLMVLYKMGHR
jgi:hypothetical protein